MDSIPVHLKYLICQEKIIQFKQFSVVLSHSFRLHSNRFEILTCLQETIIQSKQEKTFNMSDYSEKNSEKDS